MYIVKKDCVNDCEEYNKTRDFLMQFDEVELMLFSQEMYLDYFDYNHPLHKKTEVIHKAKVWHN